MVGHALCLGCVGACGHLGLVCCWPRPPGWPAAGCSCSAPSCLSLSLSRSLAVSLPGQLENLRDLRFEFQGSEIRNLVKLYMIRKKSHCELSDKRFQDSGVYFCDFLGDATTDCNREGCSRQPRAPSPPALPVRGLHGATILKQADEQVSLSRHRKHCNSLQAEESFGPLDIVRKL